MVAERAKMEDLECSITLASLLCKEEEEDDLFSFELKDTCSKNSELCFSESDDEDYILQLIKKEDVFSSNRGKPSDPWLREARLEAIRWIYNRRSVFGFSFVTAFLSIAYFDRFISKRSIVEGERWAIRLLAMACLSIAAKMEEPNVPSLGQYHTENYNFGSNLITRIECLVLTTLEWKMNLITPFHYLKYLLNKFFSDRNNVSSQAIDLILDVAKDIDLAEIRPSVIAVAAIIACHNCQLTKEEMEMTVTAISSWASFEKGKIYSCYNLIRNLKTDFICTPHSMTLSMTSFEVLDKSLVSVSSSNKRRRLTYNADLNKDGLWRRDCLS